MKERPILFSAPMVRALLEGRKTQTRRIMKYQPSETPDVFKSSLNKSMSKPVMVAMWNDGCCIFPHGMPGDGLWVRETFGNIETLNGDKEIVYRADGWKDNTGHFKWKPSIFMPRRASRILLEITEVRVERLHDITPLDAMAEGVEGKGKNKDIVPDNGWRMGYAGIWESINGAGSWDANPWVWVITFKRES